MGEFDARLIGITAVYLSVSAETCDTSAMMDVILWSSDCIYYLPFFYGVLPACATKITRGRFFCTTFFNDKTDLSQLLSNYTNWLSKHCCHRCQTSADSTDANDLRWFESRHYPNLTVINELFSILFGVFCPFLVISLWQPLPAASGRLSITLTTWFQQQQHTCNCSWSLRVPT